MGLTFPKLDVDTVWQHKRARRRRRVPLEELSFLFDGDIALKLDHPERGRQTRQSTSISEVSGAFTTTHENPSERFIRTPDRTHNRIRSPRLAASGR
jgi:hypothetical protein